MSDEKLSATTGFAGAAAAGCPTGFAGAAAAGCPTGFAGAAAAGCPTAVPLEVRSRQTVGREGALAVPLEIRSRQTVGPEGALRIELTVQCPLRSNAVPLDECIRCEHCVALRIEREGESARLLCRAPAQSDTASSDSQENGNPYDYTPLLDIMTKDVVCLSAEIDVATVARLLLERNISGAPVVDADGRPVGVVSKTDVLRACCDAFSADRSADLAGREFARLRVADIMTPMAFALPQGESVARAAAVMAFERVHRIPVVASDGKVVGLVSAIDVLRWLAKDYGFVLGA